MESVAQYPEQYAQPNETAWVLIVDEDVELRRSMREFLEASGFVVLDAKNSYDGLFLVAQHGARLRILITELSLLPVGGIKLAENALRLWPHLQIICMAELFDAKGIAYWMRYLNAQFLEKPFSPFELHERVFTALGERLTDAPFSILDYRATSSTILERTNNQSDPNFWMQEI